MDEQLVRAEFAYVGENLLLRGGYRKTHFQADQTTLQAASEMGRLTTQPPRTLQTQGAKTFTPLLTNDKTKVNQPEVFLFRELVLQAMVRSHLASPGALTKLLQGTGLAEIDTNGLEILSEKAFPEGHVDLLIKEATPKGLSKKVVVEVKRRKATKTDIDQLGRYRATLGQECVGAVLLTAGSSARIAQAAKQAGVEVVNYSIDFPTEPASYDEFLTRFGIS